MEPPAEHSADSGPCIPRPASCGLHHAVDTCALRWGRCAPQSLAREGPHPAATGDAATPHHTGRCPRSHVPEVAASK
eukprot:3660704-Prorocentrum_lima.AAC.1